MASTDTFQLNSCQQSALREKLLSYPEPARTRLFDIRSLIMNVAQHHGIESCHEALKWGEPSFISPIGSTIRYDWKAKSPEQVALYVNCQTKLISTYKERYGDIFRFDKNRAIILPLAQPFPMVELSHCILLALRYKKIKHLPLLGA